VITDDLTIAQEVTDLLQQLIRNACVNDGTPDSGFESRSADVLEQYLAGSGLDVQRFAARPGRESVVARIEGSDPTAPALLLMGHTDVVPVNADGWSRDPFGGELVGDDLLTSDVWGRGAVDMLNLTASMAVATKHLARSGFRPRGTLIYLGVADEENLATWGADHLLQHERDAVLADNVITESGGFQIPTASGPKLPVIVGEKGSYWCKITVRGTPGHASQPFRTDNALVTAAEVVRRIADYRPATVIDDTWREFITGVFPDEIAQPLTDEATLWDFCGALPVGLARQAHACTHTTFAPTIIHGGTKTNVIPDEVSIDVDIRTLPGQRGDDIQRMLEDAIGDLYSMVEVRSSDDNESTASPRDTPLWESLGRVSSRLVGGSSLVPFLTVGATDARFFRRAGSTAYGFGLFSQRMTFEDYATMFHGNDERVDVESLALSTQLWDAVARDLLVG
jgi:acetylornithine deacetylase/succinyl-diaminopimelate desuccinylase-like protein